MEAELAEAHVQHAEACEERTRAAQQTNEELAEAQVRPQLHVAYTDGVIATSQCPADAAGHHCWRLAHQ